MVRYARLTVVDPSEETEKLVLPRPSAIDEVIRALARDAADEYCDRLWGSR
jgi:hypothetical protein